MNVGLIKSETSNYQRSKTIDIEDDNIALTL